MVEPLLFGTIAISFFVTLLIMPLWIKKAKEIGLVWEDMNKPKQEKNVAGSGGLIVVLASLIGIFFYIALQTFYFKTSDGILIKIFAMVSSLFLVAGIGFVDDLFGWKKGGLSMRSRLILVLFSAVPLMVINAGDPIVLGLNIGLLYPLLVIPFGVVGATTTFNFLAGYNGLEARQGMLILGGLAVFTYLTGNSWLSLVALIVIAALAAFYFFNKNPARVFPGDVMTYSIGMVIVSIAILGNIEGIALLFFIPYALEVLLKIRGGVKNIHNFGIPNKDGSLEAPYKKVYSLTHVAIKILKRIKPSHKVYENDVVNLINLLQIIIIGLVFLFANIY